MLISKRLSIQIPLVITVLLVSVFCLVHLSATHFAKQHVEEQARSRAIQVAQTLEYAFDSLSEVGNIDSVQRLVTNVALLDQIEEVLIVDEQDKIWASNVYSLMHTSLTDTTMRDMAQAIRRDNAIKRAKKVDHDNHHHGHMLVGFPMSGIQIDNDNVLIVKVAYEDSSAAISSLSEHLFLIAICSGALAIISISILLHRLVLHPLSQLARTARHATQSDSESVPIHKLPDNEVGQVGSAYANLLTHWRDAMQERDELNRRLNLALDSAEVGIWDYHIVEDRMDWDDRMFVLFGIDPNSINNLATNWLDYVHEDDRHQVKKAMDHTIRTGQPFTEDFRIHRQDDLAIRWIRASSVGVGRQANRLARLIGTNWDVTDEYTHKQALKEAKSAAEDANSTKAAFLATMSHELRTPLNSIIGFSKRMQRRSSDALAERDLQAVKRISSNGEHLLELINSILDISKIEAGRMTLDRVTSDIVGLTQEICNTLELLASEKNLELSFSFTEPCIRLSIDPVKYRQIVTNLVSNAIKYNDDGYVRVHIKRTTDLDLGAAIQLSVEDSGIGIAEEDKERLFDSFEQLDRGYARKAGGTGLGLAVSAAFVRMHGGRIDLQSSIGNGSTFTVYLPTEFDPPTSIILRAALQSESSANRAAVEASTPPA